MVLVVNLLAKPKKEKYIQGKNVVWTFKQLSPIKITIIICNIFFKVTSNWLLHTNISLGEIVVTRLWQGR